MSSGSFWEVSSKAGKAQSVEEAAAASVSEVAAVNMLVLCEPWLGGVAPWLASNPAVLRSGSSWGEVLQ